MAGRGRVDDLAEFSCGETLRWWEPLPARSSPPSPPLLAGPRQRVQRRGEEIGAGVVSRTPRPAPHRATPQSVRSPELRDPPFHRPSPCSVFRIGVGALTWTCRYRLWLSQHSRYEPSKSRRVNEFTRPTRPYHSSAPARTTRPTRPYHSSAPARITRLHSSAPARITRPTRPYHSSAPARTTRPTRPYHSSDSPVSLAWLPPSLKLPRNISQ